MSGMRLVAGALRAFGEQLRQAVGEFGEPVQSRSAAGNTKAVAPTPERSLDGMELGPPLDAFTVEFRGLSATESSGPTRTVRVGSAKRSTAGPWVARAQAQPARRGRQGLG